MNQGDVDYIADFIATACNEKRLAFVCILITKEGEATLLSSNPDRNAISDLLRTIADSAPNETSFTLVSRPQ